MASLSDMSHAIGLLQEMRGALNQVWQLVSLGKSQSHFGFRTPGGFDGRQQSFRERVSPSCHLSRQGSAIPDIYSVVDSHLEVLRGMKEQDRLSTPPRSYPPLLDRACS